MVEQTTNNEDQKMRQTTDFAGLDPAAIQAYATLANSMAGPAQLRTNLRIGIGIAAFFVALGGLMILAGAAGWIRGEDTGLAFIVAPIGLGLCFAAMGAFQATRLSRGLKALGRTRT